jgi:hypothetical protein
MNDRSEWIYWVFVGTWVFCVFWLLRMFPSPCGRRESRDLPQDFPVIDESLLQPVDADLEHGEVLDGQAGTPALRVVAD